MSIKYNITQNGSDVNVENDAQKSSFSQPDNPPENHRDQSNDDIHEQDRQPKAPGSSIAAVQPQIDGYTPQDIPPGLVAMPKPIDINYVVSHDPPKVNWMIEGWLRHDTYVGQLFGEQQTGKSFLLLVMCCCLACGRNYGPFTTTKTWKTVLLSVEDSRTQIHIRLKNIIQALEFTQEEVALINKNFTVLPWLGRFRTINGPNAKENELKRLEEIIDTYEPDIMFGDTKSRLSYGSENNNDTQADLVRVLERLVIQYGGPFILTHHSTKSSGKNPRGASAWTSNIRLSINLEKMDDRKAFEFGLTAEEAIDRAFVMSCYDNYGAKNTAYFYKDQLTGVPREIIPKFEAGKLVQQWLLEALKQHGPVNKRNLTQNRQGVDTTVETMMTTYPAVFGDKKTLTSEAVNTLLEDGQISEYQERRATLLKLQSPDNQAKSTPKADVKQQVSVLQRKPGKKAKGRRDLRPNAATGEQPNTANA